MSTDGDMSDRYEDNLEPATPEELREVEIMLEDMGRRRRINKIMEDLDERQAKLQERAGLAFLIAFGLVCILSTAINVGVVILLAQKFLQ